MTHISATLHDHKIHLDGPYGDDQLQEWYRSLPGADWSRKFNCWTCDVTPAVCWKITAQCPIHVEADEEIVRRGHAFYEPVLRPVAPRQPAIQKGECWKHQAGAFSFSYDRTAALIDAFMGTGKSKITTCLVDNWSCRLILVICPCAVRGVWRRELEKHSPRNWLVSVLDHSSVAKKVAAMLLDIELAQARNLPLCVVVNYESIWREPLAARMLSTHWDAVIADESHRLRGAQSAVSKFCAKLYKNSTRRLGLTGTVMFHSPMDVFGQLRFLDRGLFGSSYHRFRSRYAVSGHFGADHIVGYRNQDEMARLLALVTHTIGREVLDLPDVQHIDIPIELAPKTRRLYDEMEQESIVEVKEGTITAANGLVRLLRLQQMTSGFSETEDGITSEIGTEKADVLLDLLEDVDEPIVVCCKFRHDLDVVKGVAEKLKRVYGEISGRRKDLTEHSTMPDNIEVTAVQIQAGGVGIDLTRARLCVMYSVGYSPGEIDQFLARIHRPGQTKNVVYYHLICQKTVDQAIYKAIQSKRDVIEVVMSYLRGDDLENQNG
jgi:SNF2 family DNA or RNA helicase